MGSIQIQNHEDTNRPGWLLIFQKYEW